MQGQLIFILLHWFACSCSPVRRFKKTDESEASDFSVLSLSAVGGVSSRYTGSTIQRLFLKSLAAAEACWLVAGCRVVALGPGTFASSGKFAVRTAASSPRESSNQQHAAVLLILDNEHLLQARGQDRTPHLEGLEEGWSRVANCSANPSSSATRATRIHRPLLVHSPSGRQCRLKKSP